MPSPEHFMPSLKFTLQPEIREWKIFASGANAAGFSFSNLSDEPDQETPLRLSDEYRYSISLPVPEYLIRSFKKIHPFVLRSESLVFFFGKPSKTGYQVQIFSNEYSPKELAVVGDKVMRHLIQEYAFHRTLAILRPKDYFVAGESVSSDSTVKLTLRRWTLSGRQMEEITILSGPQKEEIKMDINPEGLVSFDLTLLEDENKERYFQLLVSAIGNQVELPAPPSSIKTGKLKPVLSDSTARGR
jgi:hypothetical protein